MRSPEDSPPRSGGATEAAPVIDSGEEAFSFGEHVLLPRRRRLLAGSRHIALGSRAFDTLLILVEAEGRIVTKEELLRRVWPDTIVDETNVTVQIAAIRRALGSARDLVKTDAGRGYRIAGAVQRIAAAAEAPAPIAEAKPLPGSAPATNLPMPISSLVGREQDLTELLKLITAHRLVTLTGAGGIGKTQLGLRTARLALPEFPDGALVVELAALTDPDLVPHAIARVIGVNGSMIEQIILALAKKRMLLVIDNCEHVIGAAARAAEALLRGAPQLHVLATSREPLVAEGEHIYPVNPLSFPATDLADVAQGLEHSAVQLFVERARGANPLFLLDANAMPRVSKICRQLDGIPLAIELAAACVANIGLDTLACRLDDRFRLLTGGRRTALRRHQTLAAALDWSHELLTPPERAVLRRIAIFAGSFTLDSAGFVAAADDLDAAQATDIVIQLVRKSLVSFEVQRSMARYRLLDTTRTYALEKLRDSGELARVARRHAEHFRELMERAEPVWQTTPAAELIAKYAPEIDNIRVALDWAFDEAGDADIGIALAAASIPLWTLLSILGEYRDLVDRALGGLAKGARQGRHEMLLQAALGRSFMWAKGAVAQAESAVERALELAERLGDTEYRLRALYNLWIFRLRTGAHRMSLAIARRFREAAESERDLAAMRTGARLEGVSLFHLGEHAAARIALEHAVADDDPNIRRAYVVRFGLDQRVSALTCLARVLWLQGFPDQAARAARLCVDEAKALKHVNSLCIALCVGACALSTMSGEPRDAEEFTPILMDEAVKHGLGMWQVDATALRGWLAIRRGDVSLGLDLLMTAVADFRQRRLGLHQSIYVAALAEALGTAGRVGEGLATIEEGLAEARRNEAQWCLPELLRVRGELKRRRGESDWTLAAAEDFRQSIELAARQGARSWQLRSAMSLARLDDAEGRGREAHELLAPLLASFTEGFDTADLRSAKGLLAALR
jgi:predicted ATPase/DNA-binding winged helix-turn-helix (wHTH) protein